MYHVFFPRRSRYSLIGHDWFVRRKVIYADMPATEYRQVALFRLLEQKQNKNNPPQSRVDRHVLFII
jgi:hypothetical protein